MATKAPVQTDTLVHVSKLVEVEGRNPRTVYTRAEMEELKAQIKAAGGIIDPVIGEYPDAKGEIALISGHRRRRAVLELAEEGLNYKVPVHFQKVQDEKQILQFALVANEGVPLTLVDRAEAYKKYLTVGGDRKELQAILGKTNAHITQMLTIGNAPAPIKKQLISNKITVTQALELCKEAGVTTKVTSPITIEKEEETTVEPAKESNQEYAARVRKETTKKLAEEEAKAKEAELEQKTEAAVQQREKAKAVKEDTRKAIKDSGVTLDTGEKAILEILKAHGVDGLVQKAQRAVDVAKKTAKDKKEFAKWVSVEDILNIVNEAIKEENWD